jgi:predicted ATPase/DNA-binding SARP family transcriptional activator
MLPMTLDGNASVTLHLLGPVGASRGEAALRIGGPRQRALLALLAIHRGRWVSADQLVEEVFAGDPTEAAGATLRSYVSRLRKTLGDGVAIRATASGYAIDIDPDAIDAVRFERLVAEGDEALRARRSGLAAERLTAALGLWHGAPFAGLPTDGALGIEAERLAELRLHAVEARIEADLALGGAGELVDELEALVVEHPYREAFWRQLMLALYRSERQADALAAYHRARSALDEQLGIEPGEELVALEAAILRHEVPAVAIPAARHNLPAAVASFIGREAEVAQIQALARDHRMVTLTGVGGVGKTRLVIEAARGLVASFADGVAFVDLAPLSDGSLVTGQIAATLDAHGDPTLQPVDRLVAHLRDLDLLLVLDNCEHVLAETAAVVARVLEACPGLHVVATSREVLGTAGELDMPVPPLSIPLPGGDADLGASEAVRLFMDRAHAARPSMPQDEETLRTVARICADLEGLPLAIELAAARARVLSPAEINDRLRDRFRFLVSWRRLSSARHRTLREAMDWSYELLDPAAQDLLAELSVFAGGFGLDAVEAVCSVEPGGSALDQLQRLVEASLVTVDQGRARAGAATRYGLLETVREYGAERLESAGRTAAARRRHAEHFATLAGEGWLELRSPTRQPIWRARLAADRDNFRTALAWSLEHQETELALRITGTLWWFWWVSGEALAGRAWVEQALRLPDPNPGRDRARSLVGLAGLLWSLGEVDIAEAPAQRARELAESVGDGFVAANALNTLGLIASGRGDAARARELLAESVELTRAADLPPAIRDKNLAIGIDNLGSIAHELGDDIDAARLWREARAINAAIGHHDGLAMNDLHLAILDAEAGRHDDARRALERALSYYDGDGFLHYVTESLEAASIVANGLGVASEAAYVLGAAAGLHRRLGNEPVPFMALLRDREAAIARSALGDARYDVAYGDGFAAPTTDATRRTLAFLRR